MTLHVPFRFKSEKATGRRRDCYRCLGGQQCRGDNGAGSIQYKSGAVHVLARVCITPCPTLPQVSRISVCDHWYSHFVSPVWILKPSACYFRVVPSWRGASAASRSVVDAVYSSPTYNGADSYTIQWMSAVKLD